ncbi:carboxypeptidase-like regulatory domain-containing protein [Chitinophaga filiformis]|uniref:Carboxypeptidase regulatory-like domain-containing protein n=1 Tax=Chitinophaga filiformis TaxID=104663 RepID=A0A1G7HG22_CHIFI|nr:carboxypeptidase-like regulatory domain-containing protein [Chitinophaga filiformis]SDE99254.1 Carboxypeptidase regulatory-like domain-containing protein [Chitinophaga filiformis]
MKNIIFLSFFLCLIMACAKEGPPGPKGPDGPPYTWPPGNITGYINLRDQFGGAVARQDSVLLQTYNADSIFRAYTDTNGHFYLPAVPPGNYDISISKAGYDSLHLYVQHAGGSIDKFLGSIAMAQHVSTKIISFTAKTYRLFPDIFIPFEIVFEWPTPHRFSVSGFQVYLDTSAVPGVGRGLSKLTIATEGQDINGTTGKIVGNITIPTYLVPSGATLYLTAVAAPVSSGYTPWLNYATGAQIAYPYLGDSLKIQTSQIE